MKRIASIDDARQRCFDAVDCMNDILGAKDVLRLVGVTCLAVGRVRDVAYDAANAITREASQPRTCAACGYEGRRGDWRNEGDAWLRCPTCKRNEREENPVTPFTFAILKPDAVEARLVGRILTRIEEEGFTILQMETTRLTDDVIGVLYEEHKERSFFADLRAFMQSGPVVVMKIARADAVVHWRKVLGATDPRKAEPGTLRHAFGNKEGVVYRNVAHGSDSTTSAEREAVLWWP